MSNYSSINIDCKVVLIPRGITVIIPEPEQAKPVFSAVLEEGAVGKERIVDFSSV